MFTKITEQPSPYDNLPLRSIAQILSDMNAEDARVHAAVHAALPQIEAFLNELVPRVLSGGRLFYIGAGTSGRLGVLDASEIPPTFGLSGVVVGLIAGGDRALRNPVEGAEDLPEQAVEDLRQAGFRQTDSLLGIAASGTTPYVIAAVRHARSLGSLTACITSNPGSPLAEESQFPIETIVGPEYVTGSSRLKSGTAQKMVLNMISTTLMIRLGRVEGNKMVNMQLSNQKLIDRGTRMLVSSLGIDYDEARNLLLRHGSVSKALQQNHNKPNKL